MTQVRAATPPPVRDSGTAQIASTGSKKCRPFSVITAAATFHYDIMVRGSLYECTFRTRLTCVIASFFISTFTLGEMKRLRGGKEGPRSSPALWALAFPSDLSLSSAQVGEQPIKLGNEMTLQLFGERPLGGAGGGQRFTTGRGYCWRTAAC